jgi:hypothetical protein
MWYYHMRIGNNFMNETPIAQQIKECVDKQTA